MPVRFLLRLSILLVCTGSGCAAPSSTAPPASLPTRSELEAIVAPIALYPDPLLQRILTAATFPDQIVEAALYLEQGGEPAAIPRKSWERSVKYLANYPTVLTLLADDIDDTMTLGAAFTDTPEEVRECIQGYRRKARTMGNLKSSAYQTVIEEGSPGPSLTIRIEPTDPNVLYVPAHRSAMIYERPLDNVLSLWAPLTSFGLGVALATAPDHDDFYYYGGPFYGPGFWYGGPIYRRWYDYRHDRWHHAYDYGRWHRNDPHHHKEWAQHRHELDRKRSAWHDSHRARTAGGRDALPHREGRASFRPDFHPQRGAGEHRSRNSREASHRHGSRGTVHSSHPTGHREAPSGRGGARSSSGSRGR